MTDYTANGLTPQRSKAPGIEYRIYFAIIFALSLPWAIVSWAFGLSSPDSEDSDLGFVARAKRQAAIITPMIFSS